MGDNDASQSPYPGTPISAYQQSFQRVAALTDDQQFHDAPLEPAHRDVNSEVLEEHVLPGTPVRNTTYKEDGNASNGSDQKPDQAKAESATDRGSTGPIEPTHAESAPPRVSEILYRHIYNKLEKAIHAYFVAQSASPFKMFFDQYPGLVPLPPSPVGWIKRCVEPFQW